MAWHFFVLEIIIFILCKNKQRTKRQRLLLRSPNSWMFLHNNRSNTVDFNSLHRNEIHTLYYFIINVFIINIIKAHNNSDIL